MASSAALLAAFSASSSNGNGNGNSLGGGPSGSLLGQHLSGNSNTSFPPLQLLPLPRAMRGGGGGSQQSLHDEANLRRPRTRHGPSSRSLPPGLSLDPTMIDGNIQFLTFDSVGSSSSRGPPAASSFSSSSSSQLVGSGSNGGSNGNSNGSSSAAGSSASRPAASSGAAAGSSSVGAGGAQEARGSGEVAPPPGKRRRCGKKAAARAQENGSAAEDEGGETPAGEQQDEEQEAAEEGQTQDAGGASSTPASPSLVLRRIVDHHRCPITQQLLVDPVVAEDGHVYERRPLEAWLMTKHQSPTTNKPMGLNMVPAHAARQTVSELIDGGTLDRETTLAYLTDRSRLRAMRRAPPGPDVVGSRADVEQCLKLAETEEQRRVGTLQLDMLDWLKEGAKLAERASGMQQELSVAFGQDWRSWTLDFGEAARAMVTGAMLKECQLSEWKQLPRGTRVRVMEDGYELHKLCERPPPGADAKVGWIPEMLGFAGKTCIIQRAGEPTHRNYMLRRETPPFGRDFSFPYDALFLLTVCERA